MNKILLFSALGLLATVEQAHAANFAVITTPSALLNIFALGIAIGGVLGSVKILNSVRGGHLDKSWQIFAAGFAVLALGQVAWLCHAFQIIVLPPYVVPAFLVLAIGLLFYGVLATKRVLG